MCGRFNQKTPAADLAEWFDVPSFPEARPRYDIAPSQEVLAVRISPSPGRREGVALIWGLPPKWVKDPKKAARPDN